MNNTSRILELFKKYMSNACTELELAEFFGYLEDPLYNKQILDLLSEEFDSQTEILSLSVSSRTRILSQVLRKSETESKERKNYNLWKRIAVAASVLLCLSIGFYIHKSSNKKLTTRIAANNSIKEDSHKVYLTLANGNRIALSDIKEGQIAKQSGVTITKGAQEQLIYSISGDENVNSIEYNTIETPKGGQYQINLPDGSKVWLNAASSLKYPVSFSPSKERKVTLKGEGYFEVSENKTKPFVVHTNKQEVIVLGTHFNINTYNHGIIKTTLLEGVVKVSLQKEDKNTLESIILKPGQMALNNNDKITIKEIPYAADQIAWKDGYFVFDNANIKEIMTDLSNWYDLQVEYEGDMSNIYFNGNYLRSRSVLKLLKSIELTNKVKFKVYPQDAFGKGRRIIVIEEKNN
ncbi:FecR family protein [Pedobacter sp. ASV1-7]|uniref:FecR family protein n=1 Tax=Pedobacter sp. ASV1-7 TaxID=3145237 RepID=UPI0032E91E2A